MAIYDVAAAINAYKADPAGSLQEGLSAGNAIYEMRRRRQAQVEDEKIRNGLAQFYRLAQPAQTVTDVQGPDIGAMVGQGASMGQMGGNGMMADAGKYLPRADYLGSPETVMPQMQKREIPAVAGGMDYQGAADYLASQGRFEQAGQLAGLRDKMSSQGIDYGLNPQLGINPQTNNPEFFVTNKSGQPRFLGITERPRLDVKGGWIIGADGQPERPLPATPSDQFRMNSEMERLRLAREAATRSEEASRRAEAEAAKPKPASEGERNAAGFLSRMEASEGLLSGKTPFKTAGDKLATSYSPGADSLLKNQMMSEDGQLYQQAAMDWVRAKLRKESGAVIGADEAAQEYRTYFPMPGDTDAKIKQKEQARKEAMKALKISAGAAYKDNSPGAGAPAAPKLGEKKNGYVFIGGDPANPKSWRQEK